MGKIEGVNRSEGEGMIRRNEEHEIDAELTNFLSEIKTRFDEDNTVWGIREAAAKVLAAKEESEKASIVKMIHRNFSVQRDLDFEGLTAFLENEGGEGLKSYLRQFLGETEWTKMEEAGLERNIRHDETFGGTPG